MTDPKRPMAEIPIREGKKICDVYGYDQVVIMARRVGEDPLPHGEHITTYGIDTDHCTVAALMGDTLKRHCQWPPFDVIDMISDEDLCAIAESKDTGVCRERIRGAIKEGIKRGPA